MDRLNHERFPAAAVPAYVRERVAAGVELPMVEVVTATVSHHQQQQEEVAGAAAEDGGKRGRQQEEEEAVSEEEERAATVGWVVEGGLEPELFVELTEGIRLRKGL